MADDQSDVGFVAEPDQTEDLHLVPLHEIKQLKLESLADVKLAVATLNSVLTGKSDQLLYDAQKPTFKLTTGGKELHTTKDWRSEDALKDKEKHLLASDVVQFIQQLGGWLVIHPEELREEFSSVILRDQFGFFVNPANLEDQTLLIDLGHVGSSGSVSLLELNKPEVVNKILLYFSQVRGVTSKMKDIESEEKKSEVVKPEAEIKPSPTPDVKDVATAKVGGDISSESEAGADESSTEETREQIEEKKEAQRITSVFSNEGLRKEDRRRAEYHEFSWMYNHTLFDLMGKHGIQPDGVVMNQLAAIVKAHLAPMEDSQIRALFANPGLRYQEIKLIYAKLAADASFVGNLRAQFNEFVQKTPPDQAKAFLESTGFDSLDSVQVETLLKKIDTTPQQDYLATPSQQAKRSLSTLIDAPIDGVVEINFNRTIASTTTTLSSEKLMGFIDALTPEQLALTFFADANNPDAVDSKTVAAINANLKPIKALLSTMLKTQAIDQVIANADSLKKRLGIAVEDEDKNEAPKDEGFSKSEVAPTITSVQILTGSMGSKDSEEAVEGALTTNRELSHTQKLLNDYEKRVRRMWGQLDNDTRLRAYAVLFNIPPVHFDDQREALLEKIEHLKEPDGSLPWNTSLFSLIDWETFLRQSKKAQLADELATRQKLSKVEKQQQKLLDETHRIQTEGFLNNLTPKQMEELEYSALLVQLKEANVYASSVAERLQKGEVVSEVEYRGALASLARMQSRIVALSQIEPVATDNKFVDSYREQVDGEGASRDALWDELAAYRDKGVELTPEYYTLTIIETTYIVTSLDAPQILLPTQEQVGESINPNDKVADNVQPGTVLPKLESQSLKGLSQASEQQNQLAKKGDKINTAQQTNQAMQDAVGVASKVAQNLKTAKNPYAAAALLAKDYLSDKEFRQKVNRILMKAAQVLAAGFIAGGMMVGLILGKLLGAVGPMGSLAGGAAAGGAVGFMLGGPIGALLGGIGGGIAGYLAGQKLAALGAASGAELIPAGASTSAGFGGAGSAAAGPPTGAGASGVGAGSAQPASASFGSPSSFAQANATGAPLSSVAPQGTLATSASPAATWGSGVTAGTTGVPGATVAGTTAAGSAATASGLGSLLSGASLIATLPVFSLLGVAMVSIYTIFVIYSAFLIPLPTGDLTSSTSTQSEYATLTKQASPSTLDDDQIATVIYKITVQTRRNYQIKVTDVSDTANTGFLFQSNRPNHVNPGVSPPASLLNPRISLSDFSPDFDNQTQTVEYSVIFSRGKKVLVSNTVTITYDVQNSQGELIASGETLSSTANVAIGDHGVFCWPTTGTLVQLPNGSYSHNNADAYDISAPLSTRVFSPFEGWAHKGDMGSRDYGKFVVVDSYVQGRWIRLIYGHLREASVGDPVANFWDNLAINHDTGGLENGATNNVGQHISAGQQIGLIDSTGHSTGNHLHYELGYVNGVRHRLNSPGMSLDNLLPQPSSGTYQLGNYVTTCLATL